VIPRFSRFPAALAEKSRLTRLGAGTIPALLAHPDWERPAPVTVWLHGRTAEKELDPGRYLRWIRAGIAACAIDLPGHGEREGERMHGPERTPEVLEQTIREIDEVVAALGAPEWSGAFDTSRMALGGMSAGGMAALRRLCDPHDFRCAAVEGTTGDLQGLYFGRPTGGRATGGLSGEAAPASVPRAAHDPARIAALDPMQHLDRWRPIPLLVLHSESDRIIPFAGMRAFVERLRDHYRARGADPSIIELKTWPETGAPEEHVGFGRYSNDAKNAQTEFLARHLGLTGTPGQTPAGST
jgi:alpha-beta hydrolase superfamily lysophospholipase